MLVISSPTEMSEWAEAQHFERRRIGFVPTMGALHAGHLKLIDAVKRQSDVVVVSIFVNRLQFNVSSDFDKYPRPFDADLSLCEQYGVDVVYAPSNDEMYPHGFDTKVVPGKLAEPMEGSARPGHFEGMTTVVAKLLNATRADVAVFGQKDYQQLALVRAMVKDLNAPVEIVAIETVREPDGLALSSRNVRLSSGERSAAGVVPRALFAAKELFDQGVRDARRLEDLVVQQLSAEPNCRIDYVQVADATTLSEVVKIDNDAVLAVAAWFGDVRLIDNVLLEIQR